MLGQPLIKDYTIHFNPGYDCSVIDKWLVFSLRTDSYSAMLYLISEYASLVFCMISSYVIIRVLQHMLTGP